MRNELRHSRKIFFYDNGIRNAVIGNFAQIENRNDVGSLFANFAVAERVKMLNNVRSTARPAFWRTTSGQEIDYVEEADDVISAYEIKWNARRKASMPKAFGRAYPDSRFTKVTPDNIDVFLTDVVA